MSFVEQGECCCRPTAPYRTQVFGLVFDANDDWQDVNALAENFGVAYKEGTLSSASARTEREHPLVAGQRRLTLIDDSGIPFTIQDGETLAAAGNNS